MPFTNSPSTIAYSSMLPEDYTPKFYFEFLNKHRERLVDVDLLDYAIELKDTGNKINIIVANLICNTLKLKLALQSKGMLELTNVNLDELIILTDVLRRVKDGTSTPHYSYPEVRGVYARHEIFAEYQYNKSICALCGTMMAFVEEQVLNAELNRCLEIVFGDVEFGVI